MRRILVIGIGAGNPNYMTVQAIEALNQVDVFFMPDKGAEKAALRQLRQEICERFIREARYRTVEFKISKRADRGADYLASVDDWHALREADYESLIGEQLAEGECGAFLVWGDPMLYDSTLKILEKIQARGSDIEYEVVPGISAIQALAARHRIPLNRIGEPVLITTGRKLAEGFPDRVDDIVVMLDGEQAFKKIAPGDLEIFGGAYLGTQDEVLVSGKLAKVRDEIERIRNEARERNGWIMDTYLLRKPRS